MLQGKLPNTDSQSLIRGLSHLMKANPLFSSIIFGYFFLVNTFAVPVRLFFRKKVGERAIGIVSWTICIIVLFIYGQVFLPMYFTWISGTYLDVIPPEGEFVFINSYLFTTPYFTFIWIIIIGGLIHFFGIYQRMNKGELKHSYDRGDSRILELLKTLFPGIKKYKLLDTWMRIIVEPILALALGMILWNIALIEHPPTELMKLQTSNKLELRYLANPVEIRPLIDKYIHNRYLGATGLAVMLSGLCLFLEEFGIKLRRRGLALDLIDSEYDMEYVLEKKREIEAKAKGITLTKVATSDLSNTDLVTIPGLPLNIKERKESPNYDIYPRHINGKGNMVYETPEGIVEVDEGVLLNLKEFLLKDN